MSDTRKHRRLVGMVFVTHTHVHRNIGRCCLDLFVMNMHQSINDKAHNHIKLIPTHNLNCSTFSVANGNDCLSINQIVSITSFSKVENWFFTAGSQEFNVLWHVWNIEKLPTKNENIRKTCCFFPIQTTYAITQQCSCDFFEGTLRLTPPT